MFSDYNFSQLHTLILAHFFKIIWQKFNIVYFLFDSTVTIRGHLWWHLWMKTIMGFFRAFLNPTVTLRISLCLALVHFLLWLLLLLLLPDEKRWNTSEDLHEHKIINKVQKGATYTTKNQFNNISAYNNLKKNNRHLNIIPKGQHWREVKDGQFQSRAGQNFWTQKNNVMGINFFW